jgi:hypothetical protein
MQDDRPLRVLTILARKGQDAYATAAAELDEIFVRQMPAIEHDMLIVDNDLPSGFEARSIHGLVIGGDNRHWEFSGLDRGVEHVGADIWSYDFVHIATAAFSKLYVDYLTRFTTSLLRAAVGRSVCVGHIDCYNEPVWLLGYYSQHWIRSCFFFIPPSDLMSLGSFVTVRDGSAFFSGRYDRPFRDDAPLSVLYQQYVTEWLTGGDIGQGVRWHRRLELAPENLVEFQEKARAIFNEHMLAIRLRALGCAIVDVTWLSAQLSRGNYVDWRTLWRRQLAERDRDAIVLSAAPAPAV